MTGSWGQAITGGSGGKAELRIQLATDLNSRKVLDSLRSHILPQGVKVEQYKKDPNVSMNHTGRASLVYIDSDSYEVFQITRRGYVRFYPRKPEADKLQEKLLTALGMLNGESITVLERKPWSLEKGSEHKRPDKHPPESKVYDVGGEGVEDGTLLGLPNKEIYTIIGRTTAESGRFTDLVGTDVIGSVDGSRIVIPKGMYMKIWMRHISGPKLTVHFPFSRDGKTYALGDGEEFTTTEGDTAKGPLTFRSSAGTEAVWFVYSGAKTREPSEVAFDLQFVEPFY